MSVATVFRCVRLLCDSVANLPLQVMQKRDGIFVPDTSGHLDYLLNVEPDYDMNAVDFWSQAEAYVLLDGNAYIVPVYGTVGEAPGITRLVLCGRHTVSYDTMSGLYTVCDGTAGIDSTFKEEEIIHLKGPSLDGRTGLSVLSYARMTVGIAATGDRETRNRFANGGNVKGLITNDTSVRGFGEYADEALKKTAMSVDERFQGGERIVSLPGQLEFKQLSLSSTDMQFLESRKFTVREICRFFGVHPSFVYDDTSNNYKSAEMANVAFLSSTLNPILRRIECELLRKLVPYPLRDRRTIRFDRRALCAADPESRVRYQAATIGAGIYTINEWRHEENKPPVEGGDRILVSANLRDISDTPDRSDLSDKADTETTNNNQSE